LKGEATSTNPVATLFAWTGALKKRGVLDALSELSAFAEAVEAAALGTIASGTMTGDLALLCGGEKPKGVSSEAFLRPWPPGSRRAVSESCARPSGRQREERTVFRVSKPKVFIDGRAGTTGLQIYERLAGRSDIELLLIDEALRKDTAERRKFLNAADLVFLCLPDAAAEEAVSLIENPATRVIDASTAHRTAPGWDYGFPELSAPRRAAIRRSKRVTNPGCHATGFLAAVYPLVALRILSPDALLTCHSVTGYSGGGKSMIAKYRGAGRSSLYDAPRQYGLTLRHKHLPEMQKVAGLRTAPVFNPIAADYYAGMETTVPLHSGLVGGFSADDIRAALTGYYEGSALIQVDLSDTGEDGFLAANALSGTDRLVLSVHGHEEQTIVVARFDNLGKGASGAAVQNMNLMLGFPETEGLVL
jgi:N-acetyl-gamma-glutamyl-phosphate reductase